MPVALPSGNTAAYLTAVEAAAIYVIEPWRVGAATVPQLRRLPRGVYLQWIAWARRIEDAQRLAHAPDGLMWRQRDGGVRTLRPLPDIVAAVKARAAELGIVLTPHDRACQRAAELARRLDETLDGLRRSGALKAFNRSYKLYRQQHANARPYVFMFDQLRAELIRFLAETSRDSVSPALLHMRLRARFSWYCFYGN